MPAPPPAHFPVGLGMSLSVTFANRQTHGGPLK